MVLGVWQKQKAGRRRDRGSGDKHNCPGRNTPVATVGRGLVRSLEAVEQMDAAPSGS